MPGPWMATRMEPSYPCNYAGPPARPADSRTSFASYRRRLCGADLKDWNGRCRSNARECMQAIRSREPVDKWPYLENNGLGHDVARAACRRCRDNPCHVALGASIDQPDSVTTISVRLASMVPSHRTGRRHCRCSQRGGAESPALVPGWPEDWISELRWRGRSRPGLTTRRAGS